MFAYYEIINYDEVENSDRFNQNFKINLNAKCMYIYI